MLLRKSKAEGGKNRGEKGSQASPYNIIYIEGTLSYHKGKKSLNDTHLPLF